KGPRDHWTGNDLGKILRKQLRIARFCARTVCVRNNVAVAATRTRCPIRTPARGETGGDPRGPQPAPRALPTGPPPPTEGGPPRPAGGRQGARTGPRGGREAWASPLTLGT